MQVYLRSECIILFLPQIAAGHIFWLGLAENAEHRWGNIAESASGLQAKMTVVGYENEGNRISCVIGVRSARLGIDHGFRVAVVGGDDPRATARPQRLIEAREAGVDGFYGFDGGFEFAGMANHVGIGVIHDDGVDLALFDGFHYGIRDSLGGHFRFEIVRGDLRRGNEDALLAGERLFHAAVAEIGDVRVFFGFGAAQIFVVQVGEDLREDVLEFFGPDYIFQPRPVFLVLRHRNVEQILRALGVDEFVEVRRGERVRHLAGAVGAEVEEDDGVIVANRSQRRGRGAASLGDNDGLHEFVGDVLLVAAPEGGDRIVRASFRFAVDDGAIGEFDALPAIVAVHGVIAADQGGNLPDAEFTTFLLELAHEIAAAARRRVAAVHEAVDENVFHLLLLGHFEQREEMMDVGVHAAIAEQTHQMQMALAAAFHRLLEQRHALQLLVGDEQIDARDVHVHDAAGADVEMADFAVAHLAFGKADVWAGSVDQRVGKFFKQGVISGFAREGDGVAFAFGAAAPAIEHG